MKCKFEFKPVEKTFSDPVSAIFKPGIPFGREYCRGDVVLLHPEIATSKTFLNSKILRDALLDSREYLEKVLDVKIVDAREPEVIEDPVEKKSSKKQTKKEIKVEQQEVQEVIEENSLDNLTIDE